MDALSLITILIAAFAVWWAVAEWRRYPDWRTALLGGVLAWVTVALILEGWVEGDPRLGGAALTVEIALQLGWGGLALTAAVLLGRQVAALRRMGDALADAQQQHDAFAEMVILYSVDVEGRIQSVNRRARKAVGYAERELIGKPYIQIVPEADREAVKDQYDRQIRERIGLMYSEIPMQRKDGTVIWIGQHVALVEEDNMVTGLRAIGRNITRQRQAEKILGQSQVEQALHESQSLIQSVIDHLEEGVYVKDVDGRYLLVNHAYRTCIDRPDEPVAGKTDTDLFTPDLAHSYRAADLRVIEDGTEQDGVVPNGDALPRKVHAFPIYDTGRTLYAVGGIVDPAGSPAAVPAGDERTDGLLRETRACLDLALQAVQAGSWRWRWADRRFFWDDALAALMGLPEAPEGAPPEAFMEGIHPDDRVLVARALRKTARTGVRLDTTFRVVRPDGDVRLQADGVVVQGADGRPAGLVGVCRLERASIPAEINAGLLPNAHASVSGIVSIAGLLLDTELDAHQRASLEAIRETGEILLGWFDMLPTAEARPAEGPDPVPLSVDTLVERLEMSLLAGHTTEVGDQAMVLHRIAEQAGAQELATLCGILEETCRHSSDAVQRANAFKAVRTAAAALHHA